MSILKSLLPLFLQPNFSGISNLRSLQTLLKASPAASEQFASHGATIFEHVLLSRQMHHWTCALIRITALIRAKALPPHVSNDIIFTDFVRQETTPHRYWPPTWTYSPVRLPSTIPTSVLQGILTTHLQIEDQTTSCLKFYLDRFRPLRPCHIVDKDFSFSLGNNNKPGEPDIPPFRQWAAQKPYPVHDIGPSTWAEEQRVLRAFWRVQLFQDLKDAAATNSLGWDAAALRRLDKMSAIDFHHWQRPEDLLSSCPLGDASAEEREALHQERMEILRVKELMKCFDDGWMWGEAIDNGEMTADFLVGVTIPPEFLYDETAGPLPNERINLLEDELVWSVQEYAKEASRTQVATTSHLYPERDWSIPAEGEHNWDEASADLSNTIKVFFDVSGGGNSYYRYTPLRHVPFSPYRRLGFAIWEDRRVACYGLFHHWLIPEEHRPNDEVKVDSVYSAWRSILTDADLLEVERRNLAFINGTADRDLFCRTRGPNA